MQRGVFPGLNLIDGSSSGEEMFDEPDENVPKVKSDSRNDRTSYTQLWDHSIFNLQ